MLNLKEKVKNVKAIQGEEGMMNHHLRVMGILFKKACCEKCTQKAV